MKGVNPPKFGEENATAPPPGSVLHSMTISQSTSPEKFHYPPSLQTTSSSTKSISQDSTPTTTPFQASLKAKAAAATAPPVTFGSDYYLRPPGMYVGTVVRVIFGVVILPP